MDPNRPVRKNIRLKEYDYSSSGVYFITICIAERKPLLWEDPHLYKLSSLGKILEAAILRIPQCYSGIELHSFCIMPDHVHLLLSVQQTEKKVSIPTVIGQLKRIVSKEAGFPLWQKSYIDRVVRNEAEYQTIWNYIQENPLRRELKRPKSKGQPEG